MRRALERIPSSIGTSVLSYFFSTTGGCCKTSVQCIDAIYLFHSNTQNSSHDFKAKNLATLQRKYSVRNLSWT